MKPNWIERSAVDPRDGTVYYARVDLNEYMNEKAASDDAYLRALYLANRGLKKKEFYVKFE